MVYPEACGAEPHDDMPEQAKKTFREAQSILGKSPRGACMMLRLCVEQLLTELGYEQKTKAYGIGGILLLISAVDVVLKYLA